MDERMHTPAQMRLVNKGLLREPLFHFLILGAALFGTYALMERGQGSGAAGEDIIVTSGTIEHLANSFGRVWQRPPTTEELKGIIDDYVKEEILSREAIKLGLDKADTIIRRRLRQKMEFLAEDLATTAEPTDAELEAYLRGHPDAFREAPRFTFTHVYLSNDRGEQIEADAAALLATLRETSCDPTELGDMFLGPRAFTDESWESVASQFGSEFPRQLDALAIGEWAGPIRSGYGAHLVLVAAHSEGRLLPLEAARDQVKRELLDDRRREANQAFLNALLSKYRVKIDWPPPAGLVTRSKRASLTQ